MSSLPRGWELRGNFSSGNPSLTMPGAPGVIHVVTAAEILLYLYSNVIADSISMYLTPVSLDPIQAIAWGTQATGQYSTVSASWSGAVSTTPGGVVTLSTSTTPANVSAYLSIQGYDI